MKGEGLGGSVKVVMDAAEGTRGPCRDMQAWTMNCVPNVKNQLFCKQLEVRSRIMLIC